MREQQDVTDARGVGEQHDHAVHANANAACGRHAVLKGTHIVLIVLHGLVVAGKLLFHLLAEALCLVDWIVELGEGVGVLMTGNDQLKAMRQARIVLKTLGERADLDGVIAHKGGVDDGLLTQLVINLGNELAARPFGLDLDAALVGSSSELLGGGIDGHLVAQHVGDDIGHGTARPGTGKVDGLTLILDLLGIVHRGIRSLDNALAQLLHALKVREGAVCLHGGELGVVRKVHALITEDAANLEHTLKAAHKQALKVQLGSDAQVVLLVQRIEMRDERLGRGTSLDGLQNRGLNFHEAVSFHVATEGRDDSGTLAEGLAHVLVHDQVDIALTITGLLVGKAVELLGQRTNGLGKKREATRRHGELATLSANHNALDAHDIAQVELAQALPVILVHIIDTTEELDIARRVAQHDEHNLALAALGNNTATDLHDVGCVLAIGKVGILGLDVGHVILNIRMLGIRVLASGIQGLAVGKAAGTLIVKRLGNGGFDLIL